MKTFETKFNRDYAHFTVSDRTPYQLLVWLLRIGVSDGALARAFGRTNRQTGRNWRKAVERISKRISK